MSSTYKHKSGSLKRKIAEQKALQDAAKDEKQQKLSDFVKPQINFLVFAVMFHFYSRTRELQKFIPI